MPFGPEEFEDFHPYREITRDGVVWEMWVNVTPADIELSLQRAPEYIDSHRNENDMRTVLLEAGVIFAPEIPAYTKKGEELPATQAYYVDKRIGIARVNEIDRRLREIAAIPTDNIEFDIERRLPITETRAVIAQAMDELGITDELKRIQWENSDRAAAAPLNLDAILHEVGQYEDENYGFGEEGPEHLAPRDDI
jgi:hypothetical protein